MEKNSRIYVAGHTGLVGSAITRKLRELKYENLILYDINELDLMNQYETERFFKKERPEYLFLAAAKVGGILANNTFRAQFIYENLQIQNNIIHFAWKYGVKKLLFLGSSCIYPKECPQPMKEEYLLTSPLEYTNEPYAIAKIAGIKTCESYNLQFGTDFISVMPTNLYGPNDNYNLYNSHVLPALIRKMHLAKLFQNDDLDAIRNDLEKRRIDNINPHGNNNYIITMLHSFGIMKISENVIINLWGTGTPMREFLHSDDLADAVVFIMQNIRYRDIIKAIKPREIRNTHINIGSGVDLSISELANIVQSIVGFDGIIKWDNTKPDGTFRKLMDVSLLKKLGWSASIKLEDGIRKIYEDYV
ncbi:MAG: GDP-L-fucose synthase [Marinilabiliaceae bacterium]|nr:GDP-L-fucose synthase [Marinilabiliaceae bacterium]